LISSTFVAAAKIRCGSRSLLESFIHYNLRRELTTRRGVRLYQLLIRDHARLWNSVLAQPRHDRQGEQETPTSSSSCRKGRQIQKAKSLNVRMAGASRSEISFRKAKGPRPRPQLGNSRCQQGCFNYECVQYKKCRDISLSRFFR
jgi:hypothetical protein